MLGLLLRRPLGEPLIVRRGLIRCCCGPYCSHHLLQKNQLSRLANGALLMDALRLAVLVVFANSWAERRREMSMKGHGSCLSNLVAELLLSNCQYFQLCSPFSLTDPGANALVDSKAPVTRCRSGRSRDETAHLSRGRSSDYLQSLFVCLCLSHLRSQCRSFVRILCLGVLQSRDVESGGNYRHGTLERWTGQVHCRTP